MNQQTNASFFLKRAIWSFGRPRWAIVVLTLFQVNVIRVGRLHLRKLTETFDMNNVQVGYKVVPRFKDGKVLPEVDERYVSPAFEDFLLTWTIEIVDHTRKRAATLIRLLYKAQQLGLPYVLPPEKDLLQTFHARAFADCNYQKLQKLTGDFREEIFERFVIKEEVWHNLPDCPYEGKLMYRFLRKDLADASHLPSTTLTVDLRDVALDRYFVDLGSPRSTSCGDSCSVYSLYSECNESWWEIVLEGRQSHEIHSET